MILGAIFRGIKAVIDFIAKAIAWLLLAFGLWVPLLYSLIFLIVVVIMGVPLASTRTVYFFGLFVAFLGALWFSVKVGDKNAKKKKDKKAKAYNISKVEKKADDKSQEEDPPTVNKDMKGTYSPVEQSEPVEPFDDRSSMYGNAPMEPSWQENSHSEETMQPRDRDDRWTSRDNGLNNDTWAPRDGGRNEETWQPRDRDDRWSRDNGLGNDTWAPRDRGGNEETWQPRDRDDRWTNRDSGLNNDTWAPRDRGGNEETWQPRDRDDRWTSRDNGLNNDTWAPRDGGRNEETWQPRDNRDDRWTSRDNGLSNDTWAPRDRGGNEETWQPRDRDDRWTNRDNGLNNDTWAPRDSHSDDNRQRGDGRDDRMVSREPDRISPENAAGNGNVPVRDPNEKPRIFKLREDPTMLVYEYSDRLDYYRRTQYGNEYIRTKMK